MKNVKFSFSDAMPSEQMHGYRPNLHKYIVGVGDLDLIRFL